MILINKKFLVTILYYIVCFSCILFLISIIGKTPDYWLSNVISDKLFFYVLLSLFLIGANTIENSTNNLHIIRYNNRRAALGMLLMQQYLYTFLFLSLWFGLVIVALVIKFGAIKEFGVKELLLFFVSCYMTCILVVNVASFIRRQNLKYVSIGSYIFTYGLVHMERIIIGEINAYLPKDVFVLFTWAFSGKAYAWLILLGWNIVCIVILFLHSSKQDLF